MSKRFLSVSMIVLAVGACARTSDRPSRTTTTSDTTADPVEPGERWVPGIAGAGDISTTPELRDGGVAARDAAGDAR